MNNMKYRVSSLSGEFKIFYINQLTWQIHKRDNILRLHFAAGLKHGKEDSVISGIGKADGSESNQIGWIIESYIGRKDKKGKEIYEGDILGKKNDEKEWRKGNAERMIVIWDEDNLRWGLRFYTKYGGEGYTGTMQNITNYIRSKYPKEEIGGNIVLGNIHQNFNLLVSKRKKHA